MRRYFLIIATLAMLCPLNGITSNDARDLLRKGEIVSLESILSTIKKEKSGHILEAELERTHNGWVYEIEFLQDDGKVIELIYDAKTGKKLHEEDD